jgi:hypothetical protein
MMRIKTWLCINAPQHFIDKGTMATYNSFIEDKLVLSVVDGDNQSRIESRAPVGAREASNILLRWMGLIAAAPSEDKVLISYSGRNFTMAGATQIARFTSLELVSSRIAAVEFSGILGEYSQVRDARQAHTILVNSLLESSSYKAVKFDNLSNQDVEVLRPLLANETLTHFHLTDSCLSSNGGLNDIETSLIENIPNSTYRVCSSLKHFGLSNLLFDEQDTAANIFASILSQCTSIESVQYNNCQSGNAGSEMIAQALSCLILGNAQVRESLRSLDLQGCNLNESFGLICDPLVRTDNLEYVDLRDCDLSASQKDKIRYKLGISKRNNPPTLDLDWEDSDESDDDSDEAYNEEHEFEYSQALY